MLFIAITFEFIGLIDKTDTKNIGRSLLLFRNPITICIYKTNQKLMKICKGMIETNLANIIQTDYDIALEIEKKYIVQSEGESIINYHLINNEISDDVNENIKDQESVINFIGTSYKIIHDKEKETMANILWLCKEQFDDGKAIASVGIIHQLRTHFCLCFVVCFVVT